MVPGDTRRLGICSHQPVRDPPGPHVPDRLLHQNEIGVILDWVPSHFPSDEYGLSYFDGTHLYEHADSRKGYHPDWKSLIYNFGRNEVRNILISSALFWLDRYHADWPPGGCRGLHALPGLLPERRGVDPQHLRGTGESGSHQLYQAS